jgi:hypothetical protein
MSQSSNSSRKPILLALAGVLLLGAVAFLWQQQGKQEKPIGKAEDPFTNFNADEPVASYQMLRYVAERGGDEHQRKFAIEWLDEQTRLRLAPKAEQEAWLLSVIEKGGHPDWDIETQLWIFNNSFNYLHLGKEHDALNKHLQHLALKHPHTTMRLYALQHINLQRSIGNLTGPAADETFTLLQKLAQASESEVAGSALVALVNWEGPNSKPSEKLIALALELTGDNARTVDIRVTAMHAVGNNALTLARTLATDLTQPIQVRKAAIACIGNHGTESDTIALQQLTKENFRIAQAAEPALKSIRHRTANPNAPEPIPF